MDNDVTSCDEVVHIDSLSLPLRIMLALADLTLATRCGDLTAAAIVVTDTDLIVRAAALNDDFRVSHD